MVSSMDRRSESYGFDSFDSMMDFFSKWIPAPEMGDMVRDAENHFRPRKDCTPAETQLQKIQKAEFAIVRLLVKKNPLIR
jgi:hypothetical protein